MFLSTDQRGSSNSPRTAGASILTSKLDPQLCHIVWSTCPARDQESPILIPTTTQSTSGTELWHVAKLRGPSSLSGIFSPRHCSDRACKHLRDALISVSTAEDAGF